MCVFPFYGGINGEDEFPDSDQDEFWMEEDYDQDYDEDEDEEFEDEEDY